MAKEKIRYHAFIDSNHMYYTTDTPASFSYNIEGFLPIEDYKYYIANIEYIKINHNLNIDGFTFIPYNSYSYNVMINFGNNPDNILSTDQYINMYCGNTATYESRPSWDTFNDTVVYAASM